MKKKKEMDRLTLDSIAAMNAGMSYGKWKALHPNTEGTMPQTEDNSNKVACAYCGALFTPNPRRKYCSIYCQQRKAYEDKKAKMAEQYRKKVAQCG